MIRIFLTMIVIGVMTLICGILVILLSLFGKYNPMTNGIAKFWSKTILFTAGTKVEVEGLEKIDRNKPYIFVGNHQSHFDVLSTFSVLPVTVRFVAKKELFRIPIFGWAMSAAGIIKIDRSNREKALKSIEKAVETIKKGVSIVLFPEGTRSHDGKIHNFKKGAFVMSVKGQIEVVPMSISGARYILKKHSLRLNPGKVKIIICDPIDPKDYDYQNRDKFAEDTRQIILSNFDSEYNKS